MYPGGQTPGPFVAAYENMRTVTDGLFQSILFTLFQLYLQVFKTDTTNTVDYILIISTAISIARGTRTFMYIESLSVAYQRSKSSLLFELVDVGSSYTWPIWLKYDQKDKNKQSKNQKDENVVQAGKNVIFKYSGLNNLTKISYPPYHLLLRTRSAVSFHNYGVLTNEQCSALGSAIAGATKLKRMAFFLSNDIDNTKLSRIMKGVELCKGLVELKLHHDDLKSRGKKRSIRDTKLNMNHYFQPNQLQQISNMIRASSTIERLSLNNIHVGLNAGKECLNEFCNALKMNKHIKKLDLTFFVSEEALKRERENVNDSDKFFEWATKFNDAICEMKQLKSLSIKFAFPALYVGDKNVINHSSHILLRRQSSSELAEHNRNYKIIQRLVKNALTRPSNTLKELHLTIKCPLSKDVAAMLNKSITFSGSSLNHLTVQCVSLYDTSMNEILKSVPSPRSKLETFILLTEDNFNDSEKIQTQIQQFYKKLKQLKANHLNVCMIGSMLKPTNTLDFTATKTQVDYPGAYGRWSRFMRISRSAWNAIFGNLLGTIEFILEAYRKFVYAINHKFANVSKHLLNRDKHSLIWLFVFDVRELLMVAIAECEKPNRRKAMLHIAAIYQTYNYRFSMIYFNNMNEAVGTKLVEGTCQYLCNLYQKNNTYFDHPSYIACDNLGLRHDMMEAITFLLKVNIVENINIKEISFQNHFFGQDGFRLLSHCLANSLIKSSKKIPHLLKEGTRVRHKKQKLHGVVQKQPDKDEQNVRVISNQNNYVEGEEKEWNIEDCETAHRFTLDLSKGKLTWSGRGGLKRLIESANIYHFDSKKAQIDNIDINHFESRFVALITIIYLILQATCGFTGWINWQTTNSIVSVLYIYVCYLFIFFHI